MHILIRILIVALPFIFPWWVALIFALAALFFYERYYEIILIGFICDVLYRSDYSYLGLYVFTLSGCVLFIIVKQIKQRLIVY